MTHLRGLLTRPDGGETLTALAYTLPNGQSTDLRTHPFANQLLHGSPNTSLFSYSQFPGQDSISADTYCP